MKESAVDDEKAERAKMFLLLPSLRRMATAAAAFCPFIRTSFGRPVGRSLGNDAFS
jgi:hypothetical protein